MEASANDRATNLIEEPASPSESKPLGRDELARILVINNCQIFASVLRAGLYLVKASVVLTVLLCFLSFGKYKEGAWAINICLVMISGAVMLVGNILERALRKCPICKARITKATEEKRRCLECDTALWTIWDEQAD